MVIVSVSYPSSLHQIGNHDYDKDVLFPDHSPKGLESVLQRPLRADVGVALLIAVNVVSVDVVGGLLLPD